jgi:glucokinase
MQHELQMHSKHMSLNIEGLNEVVCLIGDIGGTNVRFTLRKLNLTTRTSEEIKPLVKMDSQKAERIEDTINVFLEEFKDKPELWPKVAVVGIAGEVLENRVNVTNISHWPICDGL